MRAHRAFLMAIVIAVCLSGVACASRVNEVMQSWVGHHVSELVGSWGPPQQVIDIGDGSRLFVWTAVRQYTSPGTATTTGTANASVYGNTVYGTGQSTTVYNPPQTTSYQASRTFWVNSEGVVFRWAWRGL